MAWRSAVLTTRGSHDDPGAGGRREPDRLEAFSDGVMAVIITIMAFGLDVPKDTTWHALGEQLPSLLVYVLSFTMIGIYWNNHHHLLRATERISGGVMWANLRSPLLAVPDSGRHQVGGTRAPGEPAGLRIRDVALGAAVAYGILVQLIVRTNGPTRRGDRGRVGHEGNSLHRRSMQSASGWRG